MGPDDMGADKLAHGYAVTGYRSQGATVGTTHVLADGDGRELAYVAMSPARGKSHVYAVGSDIADADKRLAQDWGQERRHSWALDREGIKSLAELFQERAAWKLHNHSTARWSSDARGPRRALATEHEANSPVREYDGWVRHDISLIRTPRIRDGGTGGNRHDGHHQGTAAKRGLPCELRACPPRCRARATWVGPARRPPAPMA